MNYLCVLYVIQIGEVFMYPENQQQVIVFYWDPPLSLGEQRGKKQFLYP